MSRSLIALALVLAVALGGSSCEPHGSSPSSSGLSVGGPDRPVVLTTFYPTTYFAQRIVGDLAEVHCPLPPGEDPIFWKPTPEVVGQYQAADLVIVNGAGLEKWVGQVSLPASRLLDSAGGLRDLCLRYAGKTTHSHGPAGEHTHEGLDGHTWLDPVAAVEQSRAISRALTRLLPEHEQALTARFEGLAKDLQSLDEGFRGLGSLPEGQWLYCSHPAYSYLAQRYGWKIRNFDLDPETVPSDSSLASIEEALRASPGRFILWESEPTSEVAERLAQLGLQSLTVSPCEVPPATGLDYLGQMRRSVGTLGSAFSSGK